MWKGSQRPDFEGREQETRRMPAPSDAVQLSKAALETQPTKEVVPADSELTSEDQLKLQVLVRTIEQMTGKKIRLFSPRELTEQMNATRQQPEAIGAAAQEQQAVSTQQSAGFGIEYDSYERHYEAEKMTFSAGGMVKTADGREIAFAVEMSMSREFLREQSISFRAGDAKLKDPLVINFGGNAAELTNTKFSFDIDADGTSDQINFVGPNSGFLALDRNNDGKINDGKELFGALTGDGFAELAAYDEDGNQWIDENDSIYNRLRIWSKDEQGNDQLVGLGERGIGAIYLGHVTTPFSMKDANNNLLGQVRSSGVFLHENGQVGTVQKIDLAV